MKLYNLLWYTRPSQGLGKLKREDKTQNKLADTTEQLKSKIAALESADPDSPKLKQYKADLRKLTGSSGSGLMEIPGVSKEDMDAAGSKFVSLPGLYKAEFGLPYWKTPGKSFGFPFTISDGADEGKESELFAGATVSAVWKVKEILKALEVDYQVIKATGNVAFDPTEVAGKEGRVLFEIQKDERPEAEGGTGKSYAKPTTVYPLSAGAPESL